MKMEQLSNELEGFCGTENYYQHWTRICKYTDGVQAMAEKAEAFWLIDAIMSYQTKKELPEIQIWKLTVKPDKTAELVMTGDDEKPLIKQELKYTSFPEGEFELWLQNGVLFLPSEY